MKLIVGLGNPGKKYAKTRHNAGFMALDALHEKLAESYSVSAWELSTKFNAEIAGLTVRGEKIVLAKPMTFMNLSGQAVQLLAHFYKLRAEDIIVVHDDKDLTLGIVKTQTDRGHAGHNGVRSIVEYIGTTHITRVRVGVAPENPKNMKSTASFVLSKFSVLERKKARESVAKAVEEMLALL